MTPIYFASKASKIFTAVTLCLVVCSFSHSDVAQVKLKSDSTPYLQDQVAVIKQQIMEKLAKVPGTERDYSSEVVLSIANGNVMDTKCKLIFPKSSWMIASIIVDDYKAVLMNTNTKIFDVIYQLITDPNVAATEIYFNGLWRPWGGSHVHPEGRGIDIGNMRGAHGSGVIFDYNSQATESEYAKKVRESLISMFPKINQCLSPWFICNPANNCSVNTRVSSLERKHLDHMHITLQP